MYRISSRRDVAMACVLTLTLASAAVVTVTAQDNVPELQDWERAELQSLLEVVTAARRGELVQLEDPFTLTPDFMKGTDGLTYVPFTITIDPESVSTSAVAMYLSVVPHVEVPVGETGQAQEGELPPTTFQDAFFVDVSSGRAEGGTLRLSRAFTAEGGLYDVYVALRDSTGGAAAAEASEAEEPRILMVKSEVEVPDYWNGQLQTSSVILAETLEPLDRPPTPEEQSASPYTLGTTRIIPKSDGNFTQAEELSLVMLVYNATATSDQTPNVTIEYNFHQQSNGGEEFFNNTNPQEFTNETLPPGFSLEVGHQIVAGQSVPLSMFPVGDFRLEITVTDNESGSSVVRNVPFNVSE